jgi:histidinol-phosphate/aromatic aminotransferase/cobyric acid decarboxylase-like protein
MELRQASQPTTMRAPRPDQHPLDLASGLNPYGPPVAVLTALGALSGAEVALPPADAAARLEAAWAGVLGVEATELRAGRGPAELLWDLGRLVPHHSVAVARPAWGDVLDVFPGRGFSPRLGQPVPTVAQVEEALDVAELVVISNPHLPSGVTLDRGALAAAAGRHPVSTLVVDESAIDFLPDPAAATLVGAAGDNVIVLRSGAEFYATRATRTGVAWCRDGYLLRSLFGTVERLPVSGLDVVVAEAALASRDWAEGARTRLAADGAWLGHTLRRLGDGVVDDGVGLPYRFVVTDLAEEMASVLAAHGVSVRAYGPRHGVHPGALGVFAPRPAERPLLEAALGAVHAAPPALSVAG